MLYLMLGYPGAGKTTTSKVIHDLTGAEHLWADLTRRDLFGTPTYTHTENIQLYEHLNNVTEKLLQEAKSVIFDTNFSFYKDRKRLREIADLCGAKTYVVWVTTPKNVARARATKDGHKQETRILGDMPVKDFERISNSLEEPQPDESVIQVDGTKVSAQYLGSLLAEDLRLG